MDHHRFSLRQHPAASKNLGHSNPFPPVVEPTPAGDTVDIGGHLDSGKGEELLPGPAHRLLDRTETAEGPARQIQLGGFSVSQYWPFPGEYLPGRQANLRRRFFHLELRFRKLSQSS